MMLKHYIQGHLACIELLTQAYIQDEWIKARDVMVQTLMQNHKILIAGNGGSAADAQHFAAELVGRFLKERRAYPAIALTTDSSILTSVGNDYGFENIFSRQVDALGQSGDCFIGITTSGNSKNILQALRTAKDRGLKTILLTGNNGGEAREIADIPIVIPTETTSYIQEAHLVLYHAWCESIEETLYG